jgi:protein O-mannosyl-transferase
MKHRQQKRKAHQPQADKTDNFQKISICIFLVVATLAVYWQIQNHGFLNYDDDDYITRNGYVQSGLTSESVFWAFTTSHAANWHPITWLSHMLDYQLYGPHPKGHHLTSLLLHIANTLLLFMVLMRMTGAFWQCGFVAALFALHPINVESIAWVAERKNVLSTFFWFLTMWAYLHYVEKPNIKKYGLVSLFLALGLMSKPMLVTLPFSLLLMDFWPLKRMRFEQENNHNESITRRSGVWQLVREKIPLFILVTAASTTTYFVQKTGGAMRSAELITLYNRIANALVSYMEYLGKMLWPRGLAFFYPHPGNLMPLWKVLISAVMLVGITLWVVKEIRRFPYLTIGWFWYLGTLVPVIGIVQVGGQAMANRYAYVPLIGIFIIVAWGLPDLLARWNHREKAPVLFTGLLIPLIVATWVQVSHWKDSITLYRHGISVTDNNFLAHNNLAKAHFNEGSLREAIKNYEMAVKLKPDFYEAYNNLGNALVDAQEYEKAIMNLETALKIKPRYAMAHSNLGVIFTHLREPEKAIGHFKEAIKINPELAVAHNNLANTLSELGQFEEAIAHYREAIKHKPSLASAHINLGNALLSLQKTEEAITQYRLAIKINPNLAMAHNNLKIALLQLETK